jgi:vitamin B12 transporter
VFGEQILNWQRVSVIGGLRYEHNETFGDRAVPRVAVTLLALRGGELFSGTRLKFAYGEGIKAPRFEESFASGPFITPNPHLKAESNRSFETGVQQSLRGGKYAASATYFNNLFRDRIDFSFDPNTGLGEYVNVNRALAHGAELEFDAHPLSRLSVTAAYDYTSTQILVAPFAFDPLLAGGRPLLRRPKHAGSLLVTWIGNKWGADVAGTFIGRRADSDFEGLLPPVTYAAGYGRVDFGAWRAVTSRVTAYVKVGNALNRHYEQVAGYPALRANFRAGLRFRVGGE